MWFTALDLLFYSIFEMPIKTMSPIDYAKKVSKSKVAIYASIRKGKWETVKQDGKIFIVLNAQEEPVLREDSKPVSKPKNDSGEDSKVYSFTGKHDTHGV